MFHLTPSEQMCPLKKFEVGLQTPPLPQTPYIAYGKGQKLKNLNIGFAMVKMPFTKT